MSLQEIEILEDGEDSLSLNIFEFAIQNIFLVKSL